MSALRADIFASSCRGLIGAFGPIVIFRVIRCIAEAYGFSLFQLSKKYPIRGLVNEVSNLYFGNDWNIDKFSTTLEIFTFR